MTAAHLRLQPDARTAKHRANAPRSTASRSRVRDIHTALGSARDAVIPYDGFAAMITDDGLLTVISYNDGDPMIPHDGSAAMVTNRGLLPVISDHNGHPMIPH